MLTFINNFNHELLCPLNPTDTTIPITHKMRQTLNALKIGDHIYLTLAYNGKYEIVKYEHVAELKKDEITVERDAEGLGSKNFPRGSCLKVEWTKLTMDEYLAQRG